LRGTVICAIHVSMLCIVKETPFIAKKTTMKTKITALSLFLFFTISLTAQNFTIKHFNVSIDIHKDGSFDVQENIQLQFHKKQRGIIRVIKKKGSFKNHSQSVRISDIKVADWKHKLSNKSRAAEIKIGDKNKYINGNQEYNISYHVENGMIPFKDHDEFYWQLTGTEWDEEIRNVNFTINLPADLSITDDDIVVFTGKSDSNTEYASFTNSEHTITGQSLTALGKGKGITIALTLPKGYFPIHSINQTDTSYSTPEKEYPKDRSFPIPILLSGLLLYLFNKIGRHPKQIIADEIYYPPADLTPSEVGTFHDYTVNHRDVIALIPYWGEQGFLKVKALKGDDNETEIYLEKLSDLPEHAPEYEKLLFNKIFDFGALVFLDEMKNELYTTFGKVGSLLKKNVLEKELHDEKAKSLFHSGKFIVLSLLSIAIAIYMMISFHSFFTGAGLIIFGIISFVIHFLQPRKSNKGFHLHNQLEAFKKTLENPNQKELEQIIHKDPRYFEKVFPYVVAFGLDKDWIKNFEGIFDEAPSWYYHDQSMMYPAAFPTFSENFKVNDIKKVMTSAPHVANSSNSAFGGGGSVGGGFGGGGGSSW